LTQDFLSGNALRLMESGIEYFPALESAIDDAHWEIYLESYIFAADETGLRIAAALSRAAQRGVRTHLLIDGFGSRQVPPAVVSDMRRNGVRVIFYRPEPRFMAVRRHRLRRMHRKLAVIDGRVGFVGGINIIDDMDTPGQTPPRFDFAVQVRGPLLAPMREAASHLWRLVEWRQAISPRRGNVSGRRLRRLLRNLHTPRIFEVDTALAGDVHAALFTRDNFRHRRDIESAYLEAIDNAQSEVLIANAYFLPGIHFRHALMQAAARGVRVILLLQGRVEYRLLHYATRALYGQLIDAGVEILEYHSSFLHAKVAVVDSRWATVGSSNIDPFSLLMAREANVVVDDEAFAVKLRGSLERAMKDGARQVYRDNWRAQPLYRRFLPWAAYGLVRLVMELVGYGREAR
jgi:cardiolipin synthase A/B